MTEEAKEGSADAEVGLRTRASAEIQALWLDHCKKAVRKFLKNVVIIDNEPVVRENRLPPSSLPADSAVHGSGGASTGITNDIGNYDLVPGDFGLGALATSLRSSMLSSVDISSPTQSSTSKPSPNEVSQGAKLESGVAETHTLDIRTVSDAFAEAGLACAFVLPELNTPDEEKIIKRSLSAASIADIVILDWYLKEKSSTLTQKILEQIARADCNSHGRLRLICIYTGQRTLGNVLMDAQGALKSGGLSASAIPGFPNAVKSKNCVLMVLNKHETSANALPAAIIDAFTILSDGLVPSFALAAVGAIRNNMHHMLTRFDKDLDAAYIGNRLITDPPEDVAELMRDLLVNECDSSLTIDAVGEEFLASSAIKKWLGARHRAPEPMAAKAAPNQADPSQVIQKLIKQLSADRPNAAKSYETDVATIESLERNLRETLALLKGKGRDAPTKVTKLEHVSLPMIEDLLEHGINDKGINPAPGAKLSVEIAEKHRRHISAYLAGSVTASESSENKFSRLVGLRKEAFGGNGIALDAAVSPALTTGSILSFCEGAEVGPVKPSYLLCLTPACDMLRLNGARAFSFIEAFESASAYNIVIKDSGGKDIFLRFDTKLPEIRTFKFLPDLDRKRVVSRPVESHASGIFEFDSTSGLKFAWLGELRYSRIVSEVGKIMGTWMRIGVIDSEFLRIMGKS